MQNDTGKRHDIFARCKREVEELHHFFEQWFTGQLSTESEFERLTCVLAPGFELIAPHGARAPREGVLSGVKNTLGVFAADAQSFRIWIENVQLRHHEGDLCLVTYEEWQEHNGKTNGRLSTALFRNQANTPNGVAWLHLHEVALPTPT